MLCDFLKTSGNNYFRSLGSFAFQDCKKNNPFIAKFYHEKTQWILDELQARGIEPQHFICIFESASKFVPKHDWESFCKVIVYNVCKVARLLATRESLQAHLDSDFIKFEEFGNSLNLDGIEQFTFERLINGNVQQ